MADLSVSADQYSWCTADEGSKGQFQWQKTRNVSCCIQSLQGYGHATTMLRVVQNSVNLEEFDLSEKLRHAEQVKETARKYGHALTGSRLPIYVMYKFESLAIALRYSLDNNRVRRFQLQFASPVDFDQLLTRLRDLGCDISDFQSSLANTSSPHRPTSSIKKPQQPAPSSSGRKPSVHPSAAVRKKTQPPKAAPSYTPGSLATTTLQLVSEQAAIPESQYQPLSNSQTPSRSMTIIPTGSGHVDTHAMSQGQSYHAFDNVGRSLTNVPFGQIYYNQQHPAAPTSNVDLAHSSSTLNELINTHSRSGSRETGNAAFMEQRRLNSSPLPPERTLPFPRRGSTTKVSSPLSKSTSAADVQKLSTPSLTAHSINETRQEMESPSTKTVPPTSHATKPHNLTSLQTFAKGKGPLPQIQPVSTEATARYMANLSEMCVTEASKGTQGLESYSNSPDDKRWAIVEDGITQCLLDDNYLQLVEDLEGMWQRIGLDKVGGYLYR